MQRRSTLALLAAVTLLLSQPSSVQGYCNAMHHAGYGPRTSTKFPPGWNGLARTPFRGWYEDYIFSLIIHKGINPARLDFVTYFVEHARGHFH